MGHEPDRSGPPYFADALPYFSGSLIFGEHLAILMTVRFADAHR